MAGGQPTPQILIEAFATDAPNVSAPNGTPGAKTAPFPAPSQVGIGNGFASLSDGFPPLTMTPKTSGGVPPFGEDMNGALFLLSGWAAYLSAGQLPLFDSDLAMAMSGYALGAVVQQAANPLATWTNTVAGNASDPDSGSLGTAGWVSSVPLYGSLGLSAGANNNISLAGPSDYILDVNTASGAMSITGVVAQRDGQRVTFTPTGANNLTLDALNGGSSAANQIRAAADIGAVQNQSVTIQYSQGLAKWIVV